MAKLQEQAVKLIYEICDRYRDEKTPLMMILSDIQNEYGYIPLEVQEIVSRQTGISVAEIYGVVTFYSFFSLNPSRSCMSAISRRGNPGTMRSTSVAHT